MWRDHRRYGYIINRAFKSKLIWYFTGVYIINRIFHTRFKYRVNMNFIFSCSTRYHLLRSLVRYRVDHSKIKLISTRGHVISSIYAAARHSLMLLCPGLKWEACNLKGYDSRPHVSTLLSSIFIRGDQKLSATSFYTLTIEHSFLLMRCK